MPQVKTVNWKETEESIDVTEEELQRRHKAAEQAASTSGKGASTNPNQPDLPSEVLQVLRSAWRLRGACNVYHEASYIPRHTAQSGPHIAHPRSGHGLVAAVTYTGGGGGARMW